MSAPRAVLPETFGHNPTPGQISTPTLAKTFVCDHCSRTFDGPPAGSGLLIWTRGDEVRYEEPPLCDDCAMSVTTAALVAWSSFDGEE